MAREDAIKVEGKVVEVLPNALYRVELANGHRLVAHMTRKGRMSGVRMAPGDTVKLIMTPYDLSKGCITT